MVVFLLLYQAAHLHVADIVLGCALLDLYRLHDQPKELVVRQTVTLTEHLAGDQKQLGRLASLTLFFRFLAAGDVHVAFLVPAEEHDRDIKRTAVAHLQSLDNRQRRVIVLFDRQDGGRLPLQLRADMSAQLDAVGHEVEYAEDARVVDAGQPIEFVHHGDTLGFVVGRTDEISDAIDDHKVNAAVSVMVEIEAVFDELQAILVRERGEEDEVV